MSDKAISDEAVEKKTGKSRSEWFEILDAAGAKDMAHKDIARYLWDHFGDAETSRTGGSVEASTVSGRSGQLTGWWCQMVTVDYERARGLRQVNQVMGGFEVSVSLTLPVAIGRVYEAWANEAERAKWLADPIEVTSATKDKYVRAKLADGGRLAVGFYAKGQDKSQVALQVDKLASTQDVEKMRVYWKAALKRLADLV